MNWQAIPLGIRRYIMFSVIGGVSFITVIISPAWANLMHFSLVDVGWIFSVTFAIQAILSYILGKRFENASPNVALSIGRVSFALGNLLFAIATRLWIFVVAQLLFSFLDVLYPSLVMYERAILVPKYREKLYWLLFVVNDLTKAVVYFSFVFLLSPKLSGIKFYQVIFVSVGVANLVYALAFMKFLPRVEKGTQLHAEQVYKPAHRKVFFLLMLHQYLSYSSFGFASFLIISYYLMNVFKLGAASPILFEALFSVSVALSTLWRPKLRTPPHLNFAVGIVCVTISLLLMCAPNVYIFFGAHLIMGVGFVLWFPAKEMLKMDMGPKELGRWEGFFQGLNIFTRIFTPVLSTMVATRIGYVYDFFIAACLTFTSFLVAIPAIKWYGKSFYGK